MDILAIDEHAQQHERRGRQAEARQQLHKIELVHWIAGDADQIDAISVAFAVRQIMPEVRTVDADAFAIWQHAHEVPVDFGITEGRPAVHSGLSHKLVPGAIPRSIEERLPCVAVIERDFPAGLVLLLEESGGALPILRE